MRLSGHAGHALGFTLALGAGIALAAGCAAGGNAGTGGNGGSSSSSSNNGGGFVTSSGSTMTTSGAGGFGACATFSAEAKQAPAAMIFVLDRTASMATSGKWSTAQIAIVQAVDADVFDTMSLGMLTFPTTNSVPGPDCIFNFPIFCDVSALPQIAVKPAGTMKSSDSSGVRHDIYQYLVNNGPVTQDLSDSSPIYPALAGAYQFIKTVPNVDKRIVALITDGGGSCTSVANPARPAYIDANNCADWEQPPVMAKLIGDAYGDKTAPVNTFVIGVPGSNSKGQKVGGYDTPPYSMLLALSTYAFAGSPDTVDPTCDKGAMFSQGAPDPAKPCHIDLSSGANFNATALSDAIASIRGKALGCTYDLPTPPVGQTINPGEVNVVVTLNGMDYVIPKRQNASDTCDKDPCWDYDGQGKVELIGIACSTVSTSASAKVQIYVGCATVLK